MVHTRLTTAQAAERLGVKPATLYSYVSRGLLRRERTAAGSSFDAQEVARLARSARHPGPAGRSSSRRSRNPDEDRFNEPVFVTELTLIEGGRLYYRGLDAVAVSRTRTFEEVAGWLWTGAWPEGSERWSAPPAASAAIATSAAHLDRSTLPIERFMLAVVLAALGDELRHDLSPPSVTMVGRHLLSTLVDVLPALPGGRLRVGWPAGASISERLWPRLSRLAPTPARIRVLEAALVLSADHELAPSTLAVRVAAALRADPYAAVMTGLGPASGSWYSGSSGAPTEVELLLTEAASGDAERAIGERLRRSGATPHGFGMPLYPDGDPRGAELLARIRDIEGDPARHALVDRVVQVARERGFPPANVDLGLGALAFCADMVPGAGQAISTFGKAAGWLAHAMEEYADPTRFRSRAAYVGSRPESDPAALS
jgi:citrate synthase